MDRRSVIAGWAALLAIIPFARRGQAQQPQTQGAPNIHEHVWEWTPYKLVNTHTEVLAETSAWAGGTPAPIGYVDDQMCRAVERCSVPDCGILRLREL